MNKSTAVYQRVYVWEFPVRLYHWVNGICVAVLIVTGFLIGNPITISYSNEAYQQYWFGTVRFIHFVAAFIFFFNFLVRIYWGFVGNVYARWRNFLPFTGKQIREMKEIIKVDILQTDIKGRISIGHNALAGFIYFLSFLVFLFQAFTGFALYSSMSSSYLPKLFSWVIPLMGGDFAVRQWHHVFMWFFVVFAIIHIYLVFYHDYIEGRGTTSSMIGGWKFERKSDSKKS
ncbi:MAG TPA: Ni/Fe-hydrogenase, b-type cytochrome subunit [Caldithrix abyssi]|uniref:Ni/Fe-hydrogenase, b-type cytochrome subunit n=1 Tax=Caldithrix abyssi TaxID=187145 RepID=A0A7V4U132_CALAY|nr:Ni/Fe-hydrogenase, b-type cytochrome subunit [Caldithrix abyssi]